MNIELEVHGLAATTSDDSRSMIILREKGGDRILPVTMSTRRAATLAMRAQIPLPIPVAATVADAYNLLLLKFGVNIKRVHITSIFNGVFLCNICAELNGEEQVLETCQAADGLVMAVTAVCPITIDSELFEAQYMRKTGENSFAMNINVLTQKMLQDALEQAVKNENFEIATILRDELARRQQQPNPIDEANPYKP